ncbi:MAG: type II toxin-antitoxin system PemK/MazF family toxin [Syntrophales bacterium]|nr:type II toxin-antitoxin system PemK/MazF family toxin [Syntrophales bacterium]
MGRFIKGDVVVVPFPFSDLSFSKRRPALVVAKLDGDDIILCQITSSLKSDRYSVPITDSDFILGSLNKNSFVRPNRLFTAETQIVIKVAGRLSSPKTEEVVNKITDIINQ